MSTPTKTVLTRPKLQSVGDHFYNEMVQRDYHHHLPHDKTSRAYSANVMEERKDELEGQTPENQKKTKAKHLKESTLAQSFLERCITAETVQSLRAMDDESELHTIWTALVMQC